jgi:hypothetical protein
MVAQVVRALTWSDLDIGDAVVRASVDEKLVVYTTSVERPKSSNEVDEAFAVHLQTDYPGFPPLRCVAS